MDSEIGKALIAAMGDFGGNKIRLQPAMATLARHVIHTIDGQIQFAREESNPAVGHGDARGDDSAVLFIVTGKQVRVKLRINALRHDQAPMAPSATRVQPLDHLL